MITIIAIILIIMEIMVMAIMETTEIKETKVKMADVGLGSAANVEYITKADKNFLTKMEFTPAKGE